MTFTEAVRAGLEKYAVFHGRSSRSEFWYWVLFVVLLSVATSIVDAIIGATILGPLVSLALLLPGLAVSVRRLHDIGKSGWWVLVGFIPVLGLIYLIYLYVQPSDGPNDHGLAPAPAVAA